MAEVFVEQGRVIIIEPADAYDECATDTVMIATTNFDLAVEARRFHEFRAGLDNDPAYIEAMGATEAAAAIASELYKQAAQNVVANNPELFRNFKRENSTRVMRLNEAERTRLGHGNALARHRAAKHAELAALNAYVQACKWLDSPEIVSSELALCLHRWLHWRGLAKYAELDGIFVSANGEVRHE